VASIADDGCWRSPSLVRYWVNEKGKRVNMPEEPKKRIFSSETSKNMRALMESAVNEGTGKNAAIPEMAVAGKTGTSQSGRGSIDGDEILDTWFAGYFPARNPRWAVVVLVEEGKSGAENAAPVFKEISREMLHLFTTAEDK
jgi:peptidoglycan glycosyltransferase/penicillin-binding protein 2